MIVDPLERLRAANPETWCPPPSFDDFWRQIEADRQLTYDRSGRRGLPAVRARLRSTAGVVAVLLSITVAVAVAAVALSLGRGTVVDSSGSQQTKSTVQRAQAIRYDLQHAHHANPYLLGAFAVFAIRSRTGVKTAAGNIVSRRPLSSLPLDVVQWPARLVQLFQLDFTEVREVITPSGAHLYVIPGGRGLCLLTSGGGGSCNLLPGVNSEGVYLAEGPLRNKTLYRILPKRIHAITIRTGHRTHKVPVSDGIYVGPS